ncbi:MAG: SRPBCC domain-containing protein, partial [Bacteroidetes bacterium]
MPELPRPVTVEVLLHQSPSEVWAALTEPARMRAWFFDNIPDFRPRPGFQTRFEVQSGGRTFPHLWRVTEALPPRKLVLHWTYEGYPGDSYVTFELAPTPTGTRLRLIHRVVENFPQN